LISDLGLQENTAKRAVGQRLEFLGVELTCNADGHGTCAKSMSDKRRAHGREVISRLLEARGVTLNQAQGALGLLQFMSQCIFGSKLYYRKLANLTRGMGRRGFIASSRLEGAKPDLAWIRKRLATREQCTEVLFKRTLTPQFGSWDASFTVGFGCFLDGEHFAARWEDTMPGGAHHHPLRPRVDLEGHPTNHINYMETFAGFWFVKLWGARLRGHTLVVHTDNLTAKGCMTKLWGTMDFIPLLKALHVLLVQYDIRLDLHYITSKDNILSDALSRQEWGIYHKALATWSGVAFRSKDPGDWQMVTSEFDQWELRYGPFDLDGSTDKYRRNALAPVSWTKEEDCTRQDYGCRNVWLNPDFAIILQALLRFMECKRAHPLGTALTLVVPAWPTEEWFELLVAHPRLFRVVGRYPAGTKLFTCPIPEEHGGGRRSVGPTAWPVLVFRVEPTKPIWGR
jgi:hypothetical protein